MQKARKKIVITSGYWNPVHVGHINLFKGAKEIGDVLVVIMNNDEQVELKGGAIFMPAKERIEIIKAIKYVDEVFLSVDSDSSVCKSLKIIAKMHPGCELFFANGGDRHHGNIPETGVCEELNIRVVDGVGGEKVQSSSWMLNKIKNS